MAIKPSSYSLGSQPPTLKRDPGAGAWNSEPAEASMIAIKALLTGQVDGVPAGVEWFFHPLLALKLSALTVQIGASYFGGDDAVAHFLHYFGNKGQVFNIDFAGMINEVPLASQAYYAQIDAAKAFVETLPPGRYTFTSSTGSLNHAIGPQHSRNWFFAVASYSTWGRGTATVQTNGGKISFSMDHECIFVDRYNWDGGKKVEIPIPGYATFPKPVQALVNKIHDVRNGNLTVTKSSVVMKG